MIMDMGRFWLDEGHLISKSTFVALGFMMWIIVFSGMMVMLVKNRSEQKADGELK